MADCVRPLVCWPALNGGRPSFLPNQPGYSPHPQLVRCRECAPCRAYQAQQLALRCVAEHVAVDRPGTFATLTYSDENLYKPLGVPSVNPQHTSLWLKRLRKRFGKQRVLVAAEYGDKTKRPHYHALLFGRVYTVAELEQTWKYGHIHVDELVTATILYTAQYLQKKLYGALADNEYKGIFPPYHHASQSLGRDYLTKYPRNVEQDVIYVPTPEGGYPMPLPDTLVQYLERINPSLAERISKKRQAAASAALNGPDYYLLHQRRIAAAVIAAVKAAQRRREY